MPVYYSLKVSRVHDVAWKKGFRQKDPSLYVETKLGDAIQTTNTIDAIAPSWDDTLPLVFPETPIPLSIQLKRKSKFKDEIIGCANVQLVDLRDKCKDGENDIHLFLSEPAQSSGPTAILVLLVKESDAKTNTEIALRNLIKESMPENETLDKADSVVTEGNTATKQNSDLVKAIVKAIPEIDQFVAAVDKITDANPYLKVAWYATSAFYKIVSEQVKVDKKFKDLAKRLVTIFGFVREADHLRVVLRSLESTISELLDIIITCCLLTRKYTRRSFVGRILSPIDKAQIVELEEHLGRLKTDLNEGFTRHIAVTQDHMKKQVDILRFFQEMNTRHEDDVDASGRSACLEGTRTSYLLDIEEWVISGSSQNIFWLNGVAGSGKSTIATTVAQKFRSSYLGAYLLFNRDKSKPGSVFRTLACVLAGRNLALASRICDARNAIGVASLTAEEDFKILLKKVLLSADDVQGPVLIILDGLDECGTSMERSQLMGWLEDDFSGLPPKFRFLITSRPEEDIVHHLSSRPHVHEVKLDHTSDVSRRDVQAYLDREMRRVVTGKAPDGWDWEHVLKVLGEAANGLFIWASTAVKFIAGQTFKFARLEELVSNPNSHTPQGLYATVFFNSLNWDEKVSSGGSMASYFCRIFAIVLFGKEQFSTVDIDRLLGLNSYEGSANILSKLQSVIAYEDGNRLRLQHTSFSDYLTSPDCQGNPWFIDSGNQRHMIISRCFKVMADLLHFNICKLETSFVRNEDVTDLDERIDKNIPAYLNYICRFWAQHLRDAPFSDDLLGLLTTFAYNHLLHWFEVLSLTNKFYHHVRQALNDAIDWIETRDPELTEFLRDAIKLASIFAVPISENTPHIYVSMLPLTKLDSKVSAHYAAKAESLVTVDRKGTKPATSLLKLLQGHTGMVTSVRFSSDGKRVVSGSGDCTVRVWDVDSGKVVAGPFEGHINGVISVGFSPDGKRVVSGSRDKTVRVWDVDSATVVAGPFDGHTGWVTSVGFSPDGKRVVSGSYDKTVRVWDVDSGKVVAGPFGHASSVFSVGFSPDGKRVVSGSYDKTVRVWDVDSSKVVAGPFEGHTDVVTSVRFSPDCKRVVSGSWDGTVLVWDVDSGKVVPGAAIEVGPSAFFSQDGKRVVHVSPDPSHIRVSNVDNGKDFSISPGIASNWVISEDAWIRSGDDLLLWIPPDIRPTLLRPGDISVFNYNFSTRLDFSSSGCAIGKNWVKCFTNNSST